MCLVELLQTDFWVRMRAGCGCSEKQLTVRDGQVVLAPSVVNHTLTKIISSKVRPDSLSVVHQARQISAWSRGIRCTLS